ncbi:MAG: galactose-1-phosphate uridylyltransferase [Methanocella sp. PtaU1.Bin125]|nr:MAG: galactose-1-phosphate uridylyltransferase [Methanocella sp. PtaU1.Bin125]
MNELRRDYFTDRWVIIATDRAKRPTDFVRPKPAEPAPLNCFFCPGNEGMTPPSKASYFDGRVLRCEADTEGLPPLTGWVVRAIPNLFPAVKPGEATMASTRQIAAAGVHEVIVETPEHFRQPQGMSDDEIRRLFTAYRDRFSEIARLPYVKYVSLFRNYGKEAGASLAHPHSQIIALPVVPEIVKEQYRHDYSPVIAQEETSGRLVAATQHTVAFAPFASPFPYGVWVFPRRPCKNIAELTDAERDDMAVVTRDVLARVAKLLGDPPYNYAFVQSMDVPLHMHLRIYPRLGIEAGFELNTGININSVPPESAAKSLREITL